MVCCSMAIEDVAAQPLPIDPGDCWVSDDGRQSMSTLITYAIKVCIELSAGEAIRLVPSEVLILISRWTWTITCIAHHCILL